jgi:hypothetical protein
MMSSRAVTGARLFCFGFSGDIKRPSDAYCASKGRRGGAVFNLNMAVSKKGCAAGIGLKRASKSVSGVKQDSFYRNYIDGRRCGFYITRAEWLPAVTELIRWHEQKQGEDMTCRFAAILVAGLALASPALADGNIVLLPSDMIAVGDGASVVRQPDGSVEASLAGKFLKPACAAGSITLASSLPTKIVTVDKTSNYPHGLTACFNPAQFNGKAVLTFGDHSLTVAPTPAPTPAQ